MRKYLKEAVRGIVGWINAGLPTACLILGALLVACGVGMIYRPVGVIAMGVQLIFTGMLLIKGDGKNG